MLETPCYKTKFGRRIFDFNGWRLWNSLPNYLREEKDIDKFKKCLETLLFKNCDQMKDRAYRFIDICTLVLCIHGDALYEYLCIIIILISPILILNCTSLNTQKNSSRACISLSGPRKLVKLTLIFPHFFSPFL